MSIGVRKPNLQCSMVGKLCDSLSVGTVPSSMADTSIAYIAHVVYAAITVMPHPPRLVEGGM